jgi:hypothetical protein
LAAAAALFLSSAAPADVIFSFASDSNNDGPTFAGERHDMLGNELFDAAGHDAGGSVMVGLFVDANGDDPGGGSVFDAIFDFEAVTTGYSVSSFAGGFVHQWSMEGFFSFTETGTGLEVLRISFANALFTSFSNDQFALGQTATIQTSISVDSSLSFDAGEPLAGLGITDAALSERQGFAFTLTNLRSPEFPGQVLHLFENGDFTHHWVSEGSFSASAVPGPGSWAIGAIGLFAGGCGSRRRRA